VVLHAAVPGRDVTHSEPGTRPTRSATPRRTERDSESAAPGGAPSANRHADERVGGVALVPR